MLFNCLSRTHGDASPIIDSATREGTLQVMMGELNLDLWRPNVMSSLAHLAQVAKSLSSPPTSSSPSVGRLPSPRTHLFPLDIAFSLTISLIAIRTASFDPKCDPNVARGTRIEFKAFLAEFIRHSSARPGLYSFPDRLRLDLKEDIRLQSNSKSLQNPEFDTCLMKCAVESLKVIAIPDVTEGPRMQPMKHHTPNKDPHQSPSLWELKHRLPSSKSTFYQSTPDSDSDQDGSVPTKDTPDRNILVINRLACRVTLQTLKKQNEVGQDELIVAIDTRIINSHINAFHIYCGLLSTSAFIGLIEASKAHSPDGLPPQSTKNSRTLQVGIRAEIQAIHLHLILSPQVPLFIEVRRLSVQKSQRLGIDIRWDRLLAAGRNVENPLLWDDILRVKTCKIKIVDTDPNVPSNLAAGQTNRGCHPFIVLVEGDGARLCLPFKFILAEIIGSISTIVKTTKQLTHQFIRGNYGSVLQPVVERPKRLPEIRIQFRIVVVQAEDDPFENKLNAIRRAGKEEVKERLARDTSFENKVNDIRVSSRSASPAAPYRFSGKPRSESNASSVDLSETEAVPRHSLSSSLSSQPGAAAEVSIEEASRRLQEYNAAAWIKRIRNAIAEQERQEDGIQRQLYGHSSHKISDTPPINLSA